MSGLFLCNAYCTCLLCKIEASVRFYQETGINYSDPAEPVNAGANVGALTNGKANRERKERSRE